VKVSVLSAKRQKALSLSSGKQQVEQLMMEHMGAPGFYPVSTREEAHPRLLLIAPSANLNNMTSAGLADIGFDLLTVRAIVS